MDTLLVADAEESTVAIARAAAQQAGLRVVSAENGIEALERYRAEGPRFVLVDRLLPILDGLHVAGKIRDSPTGAITVIVLSGTLTSMVSEETRTRLGLSGVLEKPFSPEDLFRAMVTFLAGSDSPAGISQGFLPQNAVDVEIEPIAGVLAELSAQQATGELVWWHGELVKSLFLDNGTVVAARSNGRLDQFASWVARDPMLSADVRGRIVAVTDAGQGDDDWPGHLEHAAAFPRLAWEASRSRWFASLAHELVRQQIGHIGFIDGARSSRRLGAIESEGLAFHALRSAPGAPFEARLPRPLALIRRTGVTPREPGRLTRVEQELLALADSRHSMGDLVALGRLIQHDMRPFLYGLQTLGIVEPLCQGLDDTPVEISRLPESSGLRTVPRAGDLATCHLGPVLANLCTLGLTGILQVSRQTANRQLHIRNGHIVFARSNREQDKLGNVLLASGRISADDHARSIALQQNERDRRLGAILTHLGALTLKELHEGLQTQLRGILTDTLSWPDGEYSFLEGALPTEDFVSPDPSTPNLLLELYRDLELDQRMVREFPADNKRIECVWPRSRVSALLKLDAAETALLSAVGDGRSTDELLRSTSLPRMAALRSLFALLSVGCLATVANVVESAKEATSGVGRFDPGELDELSFRAERMSTTTDAAALRAENHELIRRVAELVKENRRLREQLLAGETLCV